MQYHSILATEGAVGHLTEVVGGDGTVVVHLTVDVLGTAGQLEPGQVGGHIQVMDVAENLGGLELVLHLFQLGFVDQLAAELLQFFADGRFGLIERDSLRRLAADMDKTRIPTAGNVGINAGKKFLLLYQPAVQTAGASVGQDVGKNVESIIVGLVAAAHVESHEEGVEGDRTLHGQASLFGLPRFLRQTTDGHFATGNGAEPFLRQADGFLPRDVAGHSQDGIVGGIVAVEEFAHLVERGLLDVRKVLADGRPLIGVEAIGQRTEQMAHVAIRLVEAALLELLHHHTALHFEAPFAEV